MGNTDEKIAVGKKTETKVKDVGNHATSSSQGSIDDIPQSASDNISRAMIIDAIREYYDNKNDTTLRKCRIWIAKRLEQQTVAFMGVIEKFHVVYLLQDRMLVPSDADAIYRTLKNRQEKDLQKPVLLILDSGGGRIEPAYLIGKMLREGTGLEVAVPRRAKSAATLICCAASHIHMGSLSELGPIDPQINGVPALGLKNAIQHLAELTGKYPDAVNLFVGYMCKRVEPLALGYYERVVESSMQYAERLLAQAFPREPIQNRKAIARKLTYDYKDHGFVIDKQEASDVFPAQSIKVDTDEYLFSDMIYKEVEFVKCIASMYGFDFSVVGTGSAAINFNENHK